MAITHNDHRYAGDYRACEMEMIAGWVRDRSSGAVVGLPGAGKSNLLRFIANNPDRINGLLQDGVYQIVPVAVDLNHLPNKALSTLYRLFLRSFFEARACFNPAIQTEIARVFEEQKRERDAFVVQSALRHLLTLFAQQRIRIALLIDRFDRFCTLASAEMANTLRGLRDSFKEHLCFIVGMEQPLQHVVTPKVLGPLFQLLDSHICWVGTLSVESAYHMLQNETETARMPITGEIGTELLRLTGGYPSLLKVAATWWRNEATPSCEPITLEPQLMHNASVLNRLEEMWNSLTQAEQELLQRTLGVTKERNKVNVVWNEAEVKQLQTLQWRGVCRPSAENYIVTPALFASYITTFTKPVNGRLVLTDSGKIMQGRNSVKLPRRAHDVLSHFLQHPYRRFTPDDLLDTVWGDSDYTLDNIYKTVRQIRVAIEPFPSDPRYLIGFGVNKGYALYPEGRAQS